MVAQDIILKPILSEKSYADIANKKYYFKVAKKATKTQIKAAVEEIFKVKVASVNTMNVYGKIQRQCYRILLPELLTQPLSSDASMKE